MRKLAIALGVSAAMLVAGGIAWKADATTWRSGTLTLPGVTKNYSPIEQVGCYGVGTVPARLQMALRPIQVLVQALLA
jgi:hypothetical protein